MKCPCCNNEMPEYNQEDYWGPVPDVCIPCLDLHSNEVWPHAHGEGWRRYYPDNEAKVDGAEYRWFDRNGGVYVGVNPFRMCQTTALPVKSPVPTIDAPEWQELGITDAQSRKWKHWAFLTNTEPPLLIAGKWSDGLDKTCLPSGDHLCDVIAKSAPIQPDLSNGPLWVPLEVAR